MKTAKTFRSVLAAAMVLVLCLCMLPAAVSAAGDTATLTTTGYENAQDFTTTAIGPITFTPDKGTNSNGPKYYDSGSMFRFYAANSLTISVGGGYTMTSIVITGSSSYPIEESYVTGATGTGFESATVTLTPTADSVVISKPGTSGNWRFSQIVVSYQSTGGGTVSVTGVTLNTATAEIEVGGSCALTATVAPSNATNKAVTWTSTDETVATVSNGTVTGLKAGTTTITATTVDGGKSATCVVTVSNATISPISTALAASSGTFTVTGTVTLVDGKNIYIQDSTGGIDAYFGTAPSDVAVGDVLTVTGSRTAYNGLPELASAAIVNKTAGTPVTPKEVTIDALDDHVCELVTVKNVTITEVFDNNGGYSSPSITVEDENGNEVQIYKAVVGKTGGSWDVKVGDKINVTAVVGYFNKAQLRNRTASDIVIVPNTTETTAPATTAPATSAPATSAPAGPTAASTAAGTTSATTAGTTPETGDNTGVMGMVAVMVLAVTGMVALVVGNKKRFF